MYWKRCAIFYVTHTVGHFLLATCHHKTHALIMDKDDKIDAFASVHDSCGLQNPRVKEAMKQKSILGINIGSADKSLARPGRK